MSTTNPYTEKLYLLYQQFPVIATDSRKIPSKSMFFALKGDNFDGNQFAGQALEQGAAVAVVDDPSVIKDRRYLLVDDVLQSLQQLAGHHRKQLSIPVIGITGSNGKTTTKELIHAVLATRYNTKATVGNLNNHIGVPLTLLSLTHETEIAVVEMGANHSGEIAFLCELARPTHGLITNIGKAHLEGFGSLEGIINAKTELYNFLKRTGGKVFINAGDPLLMEHARGLPAIIYGLVPDAGTSGHPVADSARLAVEITFPNGLKRAISTTLFGSYNALNLLAAACTGFHFEIQPEEIARGIETYIPGNNRSQIHQGERNLLVLDAYNANPSSMAAALTDFNSSFTSDKIIILGDMLELGAKEKEEHTAILEMIKKLDLDRVFLVGPLFSKLNNNKEWISFETSQEAKEWFANNPVEDANILLKGSRGIQLEILLNVCKLMPDTGCQMPDTGYAI